MKLFTYATSPYARKVRMALDYKGVSYEPLERCYSIDRKEDLRWRDSRLEWPIRHGFIDLVAREFHAGKMMFPPDAS